MTKRAAVALGAALLFTVAIDASAIAADAPLRDASPADIAEDRDDTAATGEPVKGAATSVPLDPTSVYQVESRWMSSSGSTIRLAELRGKPRVLAIFYSTCQSACPVIIGRMKSLRASLAPEKRDAAGFVLVTMNPDVDSLGKLVAYRERLELEGDWLLLRGDDEGLRELAALLGFRYRRENDGEFSHSNMITLLDAEGRIAQQVVGLDADLDPIVRAISGAGPAASP